MKKITILCFSILILNTGYSCSCLFGLPAIWEYNETEQIFKGKVIDIKVNEDNFQKTITFLLLHPYKGKFDSDTIYIATASNGVACGLGVNKNETWVIFSDNGSTNKCNGNIMLSDSSRNNPSHYEKYSKPALQRLDSIVKLKDQYIKKYEGKHLVLEGQLRKSKPEGYWRYYFGENFYGDHKVFYKNGVRDSVCFSFYDNNDIRSEHRYKEGIKHGRFVEYYKNKVIKETGFYLNGNYHGEFKEYYENGKIKKEIWYKEDELIRRRYYDENGIITDDKSFN